MADLLGINLSNLAEQQLLRSEGNNHVRVTKSRSLLDQLRSGARGTATTGAAAGAAERTSSDATWRQMPPRDTCS